MEAMLWIARTGSPWRDLLAQEHDREAYAVDASYVRVRTRGRGGRDLQAIGRSRGGLTSKIHLLSDALGNPVRFVITGGERNDVTQTPALIPPGRGAQVLCDRGYDAHWWRERLLAAGHHPVVPGRRNRCVQPEYAAYAYRARHLIENTFASLKSSRLISTRCDHTVAAFAAFVSLACVFHWLR